MERHGKPGSVNWTGVACQPLFPGETPMRALGASQDALRRGGAVRRLGLGEAGQTNGFAADHFQPSSPDATTGPVFPQHRSKRQPCRRVGGRGRSSRRGGGERPQHRTHPPRLEALPTFLTLHTQRTGATMADARGIQDQASEPSRSSRRSWGYSGRSAGHGIRPIWLRSKSGAGKASRKRRTCPLGRTILNLRRLLL